jgi:signal transduction histidine kinase
VTARIDGAGTRELTVITVRDEGSGVPPGQEEAVFQRFYKLDAERPGSGLGLAIVRHVARNLGGDAHFRPGVGCVVVHLPAVSSSSSPASV